MAARITRTLCGLNNQRLGIIKPRISIRTLIIVLTGLAMAFAQLSYRGKEEPIPFEFTSTQTKQNLGGPVSPVPATFQRKEILTTQGRRIGWPFAYSAVQLGQPDSRFPNEIRWLYLFANLTIPAGLVILMIGVARLFNKLNIGSENAA